MWRSAIEYKAAYTVDTAWWLNFKLSKGSRITWQLWPSTKQHKPRRALLLVTERQGVFFCRTWGPTYPISTTALWTAFFLTNGLPCMILAEAPRPNRPKKDESVLHMMSFSCILLRAFDLFEPPGWPFLLHRVGHWWCAICFWCSFSPGNSYWAEDLVWRWNAPGPSPHDRVERHRQPSLLCETGPPACHGTWGLTIG